MKIAWICNIELPIISESRSAKPSSIGGWLDEMSRCLINDGNEVLVLYRSTHLTEGQQNNLKYIGFTSVTERVKHSIKEFDPDIIHIWGTEFSHSYKITKYCLEIGLVDRLVVSIQGLVSIISRYHYNAGLPAVVQWGFSIRDVLRWDNIYWGRKAMLDRGALEVAMLRIVKNVIGRTTWDYACVKQINDDIKYYHCNETLREPFYEGKWSLDQCEKHTVFFSQCHYPLKGFHIALEAIKILRTKYSDIKIRVLGPDLFQIPFYRLTFYQMYLKRLIRIYRIKDAVEFCGSLSAIEMRDMFLRNHVFVCSSSVENSSNSIGEAMLLGCPVIASDVGGTRDLLNDGVEGYTYPFDEPYMLAYYIEKVFDNCELANSVSENERKHACVTHNAAKNYRRLLEIYSDIIGTT